MISRRAILASAAVTAAAPAALAADRGLTAAQTAALDALAPQFEASAGAAMGVMVRGRLAYARGYGLADRAGGVACSPTTNFRLASVSKAFTACAVLMQVARGRAQLETTLGEIFPEAPPHRAALTLRQLLNHTAGLPEYEPLAPPGLMLPLTDLQVMHLVFASTAQEFAPGTAWSYSNSAYAILAMAVEQLSGRRYDLFLRDEIFRPLGMAGTVAYVPGANHVEARAYGNIAGADGQPQFADQTMFSAVLGDGGIYSSVQDMARWDAALGRGALLPAGLWSEAYRPVGAPRAPQARGPVTDYGMGWMVEGSPRPKRLYHTGSSTGFRTQFDRRVDSGVSIIILVNDARANTRELDAAVVKALGV